MKPKLTEDQKKMRAVLDVTLERAQLGRAAWHPGRLRRGCPIIGRPLSTERRDAVRQLLRPLMDENEDIQSLEREQLESVYMLLPQNGPSPLSSLFNTSPSLFAAARQSYSERAIFLVVVEGHVVAGSDGIVARFQDDATAEACLVEAGYTRDITENKIYKP